MVEGHSREKEQATNSRTKRISSFVTRKIAVKAIMRKLGASIAGPVGFLASIFFDKLIRILQEELDRFIKQKTDDLRNNELKKVDEENAKKYKEVISSGSSTEREIEEASLDFLNGSRK